MPLNTSGADVMLRIMAEDAASAKFKALEMEADRLMQKMDGVNKSASSQGGNNGFLNQLAKDAKGATTGTDSLIGSMRSLATSAVAVTAVVVAAGAAIKGAFEFSEEGAQLERLRASSDALADHYGANMTDMVTSLRAASQGTIADTDLMLSANKAMMLGVTTNSEQMANLLQIAALRGRAMGEDVTKAFNDIVVGIGRMSPRILDNLGIVIDSDTAYAKYAESIGKTSGKLTDLEKRQALLNAVLEEGNTMLDEAGGLADDTASSYERLRASWANYTDELKMGAASTFEPINNWLADTLNNYVALSEAQQRYNQSLNTRGVGPMTDRQKYQYYQNMAASDTASSRYDNMSTLPTVDAEPILAAADAQSRLNELTGEYIGMNMADQMAQLDAAVQSLTFSTQDYFGLVQNLNAVEMEYSSTMDELAAKRQEIMDNQKLSEEERAAALQKVGEAEEQAAAKAIESSKQIVFGLIAQKLAAEGNYGAIIQLGEAWGLIDPNVGKAAEEMLAVLDDGTKSAKEQADAIEDIAKNMLGLKPTAEKAGSAIQTNLEPATNELQDARVQAHGLKEQLDSIAKKSGSVWTFTVIINTVGSVPSLPSSNPNSANHQCFVPGTKISMADGSHRNIEDVRAGDVVLSMDLTTGQLVHATVEYVVNHEAEEVDFYMSINGIGVTPEHPLYVNGDWKAAGDVELGDLLMGINGQSVPVVSIEYVTASVPVYNLHTSHDTHNYFADGILAHNKTTEGNGTSGGSGSGSSYASGGDLPLGRGWAVVGDGPGGTWTPFSELISPSGRVYSHAESEVLMAAGLAPDTYLREGGGTPSAGEAAYYASQRRTPNRRPIRNRTGSHRARGNMTGESGPAAPSADETASVISEAAAQTANVASAVVQTGQAQTQATQTQTTIVSQGNDAMVTELQEIRRLLTRMLTAQEQLAIARFANATTVN